MRARVTDLPLVEPARFDPDQLEQLCAEIGEVRAEAEVAQALNRISRHLDTLARGGGATADQKVLTGVAGLARDADHIGMTTLARVARDVLASAASADKVAMAATLARLRRVGDRSIQAVWDLDDMSC